MLDNFSVLKKKKNKKQKNIVYFSNSLNHFTRSKSTDLRMKENKSRSISDQFSRRQKMVMNVDFNFLNVNGREARNRKIVPQVWLANKEIGHTVVANYINSKTMKPSCHFSSTLILMQLEERSLEQLPWKHMNQVATCGTWLKSIKNKTTKKTKTVYVIKSVG